MNRAKVCDACGWIHSAIDAPVVGSRFRRHGPNGFAARTGGPVRATREEALADHCRNLAEARVALTAPGVHS